MLDAGCGTGNSLPALAAAHPGRPLLALDLAAPMLARSRGIDAGQCCLQGDVQSLPLADASLAAVWSSLSLQWCDPALALAEIGRCLRPGGMAWLATLGPDTFYELRHAFAGIDRADHVLDCPAPEAWRAAVAAAGLELRAEQRCRLAAKAPDLRTLLRDIKAIGAQGIGPGRRRALLGKRAWQTVVSRYEAYRDSDGQLQACYDTLFLVLRKPQ